ncbi:DUF3046 domain-containing protein [Nesterenkonia natronophila]|uniref:DUF3046 domain-containing protein n=1 Tax=Nesterenkonia natronophila TaxID=2174932 RepID=A0A3A4G4E4_9MICC|nr:DUF3046 domain-containing protein [Nesterenkonia natronophila]RJN33249.1 DUF3046 domain-containing protein [Nesterenkonia natronophila]
MRESRFWMLMEEEFGKNYAHVLADQLVITPFQLTAREALGAGVSTREVWEALCIQQDVPEERRLGRDIPPKP